MARRRCRRPAGGIGKVQQRTGHTAVHTNRPPLRSWNSFSISTAEPMANNEMKMRMPKVIVFCVGLWDSALLSGPLSLSGLSDRQRISRKVNHEVGPQGRRNVENCAGDNILEDLLILFHPGGQIMAQLISLYPPQFLTFRRPWLPHFTFRN